MGDLIDFAELRRARFQRRSRSQPTPSAGPALAELAFDLASPSTYLLAERVERAFAEVTWTPVPASALPALPARTGSADAGLAFAEERARALRLPLVWPDPVRSELPRAMRLAAFASAQGRGAVFVIAATRLAFGGGYDLEEPEYLEEAAAAAGLDPGEALRAALDPAWDLQATAAATRLGVRRATELPLLRTGGREHSGEARITQALAALRDARVAASSS